MAIELGRGKSSRQTGWLELAAPLGTIIGESAGKRDHQSQGKPRLSSVVCGGQRIEERNGRERLGRGEK